MSVQVTFGGSLGTPPLACGPRGLQTARELKESHRVGQELAGCTHVGPENTPRTHPFVLRWVAFGGLIWATFLSLKRPSYIQKSIYS